MIDLHSHVLFGLDDGARTIDDAVAMARAAVADGTTTMVATPHFDHPQYRTAEEAASRTLAALRARIAAEGIPLELLAGGELTFSEHTRGRVQRRQLPVIAAGPWVLLELYDPLPPGIDDELFQFGLHGYQVLLAHPERFRAVQSSPDLVQRWVERGMHVQITAQSLTGEMGQRNERAARTLLERRLVHVIASDTHNAARRPPGLSRAREVAADLLGSEEAADALVTRNPRAIVEGGVVDAEAPRRPPRSWLSRLVGGSGASR